MRLPFLNINHHMRFKIFLFDSSLYLYIRTVMCCKDGLTELAWLP